MAGRITGIMTAAAAAGITLALLAPGSLGGKQASATVEPETIAESVVGDARETDTIIALSDENGISFREEGSLREFGRLDGAHLWDNNVYRHNQAPVMVTETGVIACVTDEAGNEKCGYYLPKEERYLLEPLFDNIEVLQDYICAFAGGSETAVWTLYTPRGEIVATAGNFFRESLPEGRYLYSYKEGIVIDAASGEIVTTEGLPVETMRDDGLSCVSTEDGGQALVNVLTGTVCAAEADNGSIHGIGDEYLCWDDKITDGDGNLVIDRIGIAERNPEYKNVFLSGGFRFLRAVPVESEEDASSEDGAAAWWMYLDGPGDEEGIYVCDEDFGILASYSMNSLDFGAGLSNDSPVIGEGILNRTEERFYQSKIDEDRKGVLLTDIVTGEEIRLTFGEPLPGMKGMGNLWIKKDGLVICQYRTEAEGNDNEGSPLSDRAEHVEFFVAGNGKLWKSEDHGHLSMAAAGMAGSGMIWVNACPACAPAGEAEQEALFFTLDGEQVMP